MTSQLATNLDSLPTRFPLPVEGVVLQSFSDTAVVSGVEVRLAGFAAEFDGECITGSAAALDETPVFRAYMELVERLSLLVAMRRDEPITLRDADGSRVGLAPSTHLFPESPDASRWKWARSNGVAIASTWEDAAARARWELIERDRVLRSFYGEILPRRVSVSAVRLPPALRSEYGFEVYAFDAPFGDGATAAGVFGFPRGSGPLVYGFGARASREDAIAAAANECLQRLGFLFGEAIPDCPPAASPSPDYHQEYFLFTGHHERLRKWLRGEHGKYRGCLNDSYAAAPEEPRYADLTPPALAGRLFVAKAIPNGHVPLAFGTGVPMLRSAAPGSVAVHPIA